MNFKPPAESLAGGSEISIFSGIECRYKKYEEVWLHSAVKKIKGRL
jgi:hypothetical protein